MFVTSCQQVWNKLCLLQVVNKFGTSCVCYKLSTSLEQVVFVTSCQQVWNKLCLLQVVNKFGTSCVCYKLSTSLEQVVFVISCQQVWNKLLTTCSNLVDIFKRAARFFQQGCYNHDIKILLSPCVVNLVTFWLYIMNVSDMLEQPCNKSDNAIKLVTSCKQLVLTCYNKLGTSSANTTC